MLLKFRERQQFGQTLDSPNTPGTNVSQWLRGAGFYHLPFGGGEAEVDGEAVLSVAANSGPAKRRSVKVFWVDVLPQQWDHVVPNYGSL